MGADETLGDLADAGAIMDADGSAPVLVEMDDVVVRARLETVGLAIDVPDVIAVVIDARLVGSDPLEGDAIHGAVLSVVGEAGWLARRAGGRLSLRPPWRSPRSPLLSTPVQRAGPRAEGVEQGRDPGGERLCAECDQIVVEVAAFGDDDGGGDVQVATAPPEAVGGALALGVVVAGDDEAGEAGRRREGAEASGRERGGGGDGGDCRNQGEHGLDALADEQGAVAGAAEADGAAVDVAERLAWMRDLGLGGGGGIEPGAMDAVDGAVVVGDGGDERRQASEATAVAVVEGGMEAERGEAAAVDGAGMEIVLGVGAVDGAAGAPEAACGLDAVVCGGLAAGGGPPAWRGRRGLRRGRA